MSFCGGLSCWGVVLLGILADRYIGLRIFCEGLGEDNLEILTL